MSFLMTTLVNAQSSVELTSGITFSKLNYEGDIPFVETESGNSIYVSLGYQYQFGKEKRMAIGLGTEFLKRNAKLNANASWTGPFDITVRAVQFGVVPKFRYFFGKETSEFSPFLGTGITFRFNIEATDAGFDMNEERVNSPIIGGIYNAGFFYGFSEQFSLVFETGVMNDFQDNFDRFYAGINEGKTKFFDFYLRAGLSYGF